MKTYYHVTGPKGFTMHLRPDEISLLAELGFISLERVAASVPAGKHEIHYYVPCVISEQTVLDARV